MIVLGDVHRRWEDVARIIDDARLRGRTIIQVGDFGLGFGPADRERQQLVALGASLSRRHNRLLVVRGNHDDPAIFRVRTELGAAIRIVPDYSVEMVEGHKVFLAGGATSVDRKLRRAGQSYWPDETFLFDQARLDALDLGNLHMVITHTAPSIVPPSIDDPSYFVARALPAPPLEFRIALRRLYARDETLASDVFAERRALDALYHAIRVRTAVPHWIYGHFHHHSAAIHNGTRFTMLGELQLLEIEAGPAAAI